MADEIKIFRPETIPDLPLPGIQSSSGNTTGTIYPGQVYQPETYPDTGLPQTVIASEVRGVVRSISGKKIVDELGLVSSESFLFGSVEDINNGRSTASTSFVDIPNTSIDFELKRDANLLFLIYADPSPVSIVNYDILRIQMALDIDGTLYPDPTNGWGIVYKINDTNESGYTEAYGGWHGHLVVSLVKGPHTAKLKWKRGASDSDEAGINNTVLTYLVLGK